MIDWHFERIDDLALHGLSSGPLERMAISIHGSWGNFYENAIALGTADSYRPHGFGHASVNTRGHDGGTANEDLSTTSADIQAWMRRFERRGTRQWILQGHSLGALKIIRGLIDKSFGENLLAAVLLSPFDLPAFYAGSGDAEAIEEKKARAVRLINEYGADAPAPPDLFDIWPISVGTLSVALSAGGPLDLFPTRMGSLSNDLGLDVPTLVVLGGADFAATPNNHAVMEQLRDTGVRAELVENAPHNFAGFETDVNTAISRFVNEYC